MRTVNVVLSATALSGAALLTLGANGGAFTTTGHVLDTTQRDFRVCNNFTDPTANDNTTADPSFPGYTGATLAIWKACIEWGSRLHGDGSGDTTQPANLGSGGANFDVSFQGHATSPGGLDDNVFSELIGSEIGVLGFTEYGTAGGWRIRFYSNWTWNDGPDPTTGSQKDIQGLATSLYGFALGLGTSAVAGATMMSPVSGPGVPRRSIEADDIAGIQSIYGVASASKPEITALSLLGGSVTIQGQNFSPAGNEVWFTQASAGGTGDPIVVSGVASNGTQITVSVPLAAGPGDVLVKGPGMDGSVLSNAWPFDLCPAPANYCVAAPNSVGPGAHMGHLGSTSFAQNDLQLVTTGCPPDTFGIFYYGQMETEVPFGNGFRCIGGPVQRLSVTTVDGSGVGYPRLRRERAAGRGDASQHVGLPVLVSQSGWRRSGLQPERRAARALLSLSRGPRQRTRVAFSASSRMP